jgi:excisionase family DNA binding protein
LRELFPVNLLCKGDTATQDYFIPIALTLSQNGKTGGKMHDSTHTLKLILAKLENIEQQLNQSRPDFLSIQDFAKQSGISVSGIRKMIADGRIKATKTGKTAQAKVLIPSGELKNIGRRK